MTVSWLIPPLTPVFQQISFLLRREFALEKLHIPYGLISSHLTPLCAAKPRSHFHDRESWHRFHIRCEHELTTLYVHILDSLDIYTPPDGTDHNRQYTFALWASQCEWQFGAGLHKLSWVSIQPRRHLVTVRVLSKYLKPPTLCPPAARHPQLRATACHRKQSNAHGGDTSHI